MTDNPQGLSAEERVGAEWERQAHILRERLQFTEELLGEHAFKLTAANARIVVLEQILAVVANWPITDPRENMDAANMALTARRGLAAPLRAPQHMETT